MAGERNRFGLRFVVRLGIACLLLFAASGLFGQNWQKVHKADDNKWAKTTGLDPSVVHKLWKDASTATDEKLDESRIANLDLQGLAVRHDVLLATYTGEKNCLTITVFRQFSPTGFKKLWSVSRSPDGSEFCDTDFGGAGSDANEGVVTVSVPLSRENGEVIYRVYAYDWNGMTYKFLGQKDVKGR